uniref:Uncharacterized protein n=1 Tax=Vespula pensylvanica TaxID=30213 RepID=A0A834JZ47_VESPE|nr:hypothetical protein H0235_016639 [Vespula pensylvanica]
MTTFLVFQVEREKPRDNRSSLVAAAATMMVTKGLKYPPPSCTVTTTTTTIATYICMKHEEGQEPVSEGGATRRGESVRVGVKVEVEVEAPVLDHGVHDMIDYIFEVTHAYYRGYSQHSLPTSSLTTS